MNTSSAGKGPTDARLGFKLRDLTDRVRNLENRRARAGAGGSSVGYRVLNITTDGLGGVAHQNLPFSVYFSTASIAIPVLSGDVVRVTVDSDNGSGVPGTISFASLNVYQVASAAAFTSPIGSGYVAQRNYFGAGTESQVVFPAYAANANFEEPAFSPGNGLKVLHDGWYFLTSQIAWAS